MNPVHSIHHMQPLRSRTGARRHLRHVPAAIFLLLVSSLWMSTSPSVLAQAARTPAADAQRTVVASTLRDTTGPHSPTISQSSVEASGGSGSANGVQLFAGTFYSGRMLFYQLGTYNLPTSFVPSSLRFVGTYRIGRVVYLYNTICSAGGTCRFNDRPIVFQWSDANFAYRIGRGPFRIVVKAEQR